MFQMGPVSSVLLDRKIGFEEIHQLDEFLRSIASGEIVTTKSTRDFWVDSDKLLKLSSTGSNCQFSVSFDNELNEMDPNQIIEIELFTNKVMKSQVVISAGCNRSGDHNVLGELTLAIAETLNGWIDFAGDLDICEKEIGGKIYSIKYNEGAAEYHISDSDFLVNWIKHPNFRMIK